MSRTYCSTTGPTGTSGLHSRLTRRVRPRLEGKKRTPLSCQVATGISWSPLRGIKGVKPPMEFGEMTRDCFPGHAGKKPSSCDDGGVSWVFSSCGASIRFLTRYDGELREPLVQFGFLKCLMPQWQPTPVLLPGKSHGQRSLVGCSP